MSKSIQILIFFLLIFPWTTIAQDLEGYIVKCENFQIERKPDSIVKYATIGQSLAERASNENFQARFTYFLGLGQLRSKPDSAQKFFAKAYRLATKLNDHKYLPLITNAQGNYFGIVGKNDRSIEKYLETIQHYKDAEAKTGQKTAASRLAGLEFNIAAAYGEMSDLEKSLQHAIAAHEIAENNKILPVKAACLNIFGVIYEKQGQIDKAEKSFLEAKEMAIQAKDINRVGAILSNLGSVFERKYQKTTNEKSARDKAKRYFSEALAIAKQINDKTGIANRTMNLANVARAEGNLEKALSLLMEAMQNAKEVKSKIIEKEILFSMAKTHFDMGDLKNSIEKADQALALSKEIKNEDITTEIYTLLQKAHHQNNDFKKAIEFQQKIIDFNEKKYASSMSKDILTLQEKYENEKKLKEIALLTNQNQLNATKIKEKNFAILASLILMALMLLAGSLWYRQQRLKTLQTAAEMKQRLLRAQLNPHFLFNCLNSIQRLYIEGKTHIANDFIADFAQLMRDILDKTDRTKISIFEEMNFLRSYLSLEKRRLGDKFDFEIVIDDLVMHSDFQLPSLIVQPLVENALLHGILPKNEKGLIKVLVSINQSDEISIIVEDNGVGFKDDSVKNHVSKGMQMIKNRLGNKGKLLIESLKSSNKENSGTRVSLIFSNI